MGFKSIIVSPVIRPDQDYHRRELWHLKQEIKKAFKEYGSTSCSYLLRNPESSFYGYSDNFAIIDFKKKEGATRALKAVENGKIIINKITITAKPIEMTHCPVDKLPDNCLLEIFKHLSTYEQLKLSVVCKRWGVASQPLWRKVTNIDLRDNSLVHRNKNYIIHNGPRLKEIYCYDDHGLKTIGKYCKNLEKISIEFRKYTKKKGLDRPCIQYEFQILQKFNNLTRLLLKIRTPQYNYFSLLKHLPSSMIEIHLFNDIKNIESLNTGEERTFYPSKYEEFVDSREKYSRKALLDLSHFPNLQALTLRGYHLNDNSLMFLEKSEKLICLRLDDSHLSQCCLDKLKFSTNLKHLSLKRVLIDYEDMRLILKRNQILKYLALPTMKQRVFEDVIWLRALELKHLKVLCYTDIGRMRERGVSTTIEYVDYHNDSLSCRRTLLFLEDFPNLRVFKKTGIAGFNNDWFISEVKNVIASRVNKIPMKYYHNPRKIYPGRLNIPIQNQNSSYFEHSDVVSIEDTKIFRCNEWDGWYIEDTSEQIDKESNKSRITASSLIKELSDTCLNRIFDYLPLDDKLTAAEVCKRWKKVLGENWEKCKRFDMRELSRHENREKCMIQCGKYFEEIYSYENCGLSGIENYCPNVKSLALDFGVERCSSLPIFRPMLMGLKQLSRIMLRDAPVFQSDIFQHLPENLEEIHVFNKCTMSSEEVTESQLKDNPIILDLSRYSKLQALTLIDTQATQQVLSRNSTRVIGLDNLEELIYLRVSGVVIAQDSGNPMKNIKKLEYLSLPLSTLSPDNFVAVIENNRNIEYLDISDNYEGVPNSQFLPVLTLQGLKYLRMVEIGATTPVEENYPEYFGQIPEEFDYTDVLPHLQIFDCEGLRAVDCFALGRLMMASPNLKMLNVTINGGYYNSSGGGGALYDIAENMGDQHFNLRAFVGLKAFSYVKMSRFRHAGAPIFGVELLLEVFGADPPQKYREIVDRSYWGEWSTQNGSANISKLCSQLLNCINS